MVLKTKVLLYNNALASGYANEGQRSHRVTIPTGIGRWGQMKISFMPTDKG